MMPIYSMRCDRGHEYERFLSVKESGNWLSRVCVCGNPGTIQITAPLLVKASAAVHYTSPIDDRPITSMAARHEDLKRNGCTPYDPDQRTDYDRRIQEAEASLDRDIEATVEEAVNKMDGEGRRRLASELLDQGTTADVVRSTP